VDINNDMENGVRVQKDNLDLIVIKESVEEVASRKAESALEERGEHHNLSCIGCRDVFSCSRAPLQHDTVGEKMIPNKFANLLFNHVG
jgi:hypothetical protein